MKHNIYLSLNQEELNIELLNLAQERRLKEVKYLLTSPDLKIHADIHYKKNSENILMYACMLDKNIDVLEYLLFSDELSEHPSINEVDKYGNNILMFCCLYNSLDNFKFLMTHPKLKSKIDIYKSNFKYETPFMYACVGNYLNMISFMIVDLDMNIDKDTMMWLHGNNSTNKKYNNVLEIIAKKNLYTNLKFNLSNKVVNVRKKIKI